MSLASRWEPTLGFCQLAGPVTVAKAIYWGQKPSWWGSEVGGRWRAIFLRTGSSQGSCWCRVCAQSVHFHWKYSLPFHSPLFAMLSHQPCLTQPTETHDFDAGNRLMNLTKEELQMNPRPIHVVSPPLFQSAFTERLCPSPEKEPHR